MVRVNRALHSLSLTPSTPRPPMTAPQRIAIIGTGISGIGAGLALDHAGHEVVFYEKDRRPGGHSATVDIVHSGEEISVDTGFIVYNELNYPNLTAMFDWLQVHTQDSDMSFSVSADGGKFEWCGRNGDGVFRSLFAQRSNLFSPSFIRMLQEILTFQKKARSDRAAGTIGSGTLGDYLTEHKFSQRLRDDYLVPMGAAIWSTSPTKMLEFPAQSFIDFWDNHRLLQWDRPQWRTVHGGSRNYVRRALRGFGERVRLNAGVTQVTRHGSSVSVVDTTGHSDTFDQVVIGAHAPDALAMLTDPTALEQKVLSACSYSPNTVILHRDPRLMPRRKDAWAAWNFLRNGKDDTRKVAVTYWMNILQGINKDLPTFVTLNPPFEPDPALTFARFTYEHPLFDTAALEARHHLNEIQGQSRTWFCGAWTGHGFHEDGLRSGLEVAAALGAQAPWLVPATREPVAAE